MVEGLEAHLGKEQIGIETWAIVKHIILKNNSL